MGCQGFTGRFPPPFWISVLKERGAKIGKERENENENEKESKKEKKKKSPSTGFDKFDPKPRDAHPKSSGTGG